MPSIFELSPDFLTPGVSILEKILRPLVVYFFLIALIRLGGRREIAQINSFDFVVLLLLSNTVQNAIIGSDTSLLGGIVGAIALVVTNVAVNRFFYLQPRVERAIEGVPTVLVTNGVIQSDALKRERITEGDLVAAVHRQGIASVADCEEIIIEINGSLAVIPREGAHAAEMLKEVLRRLDQIEHLLPAGQDQREANG